MFFQTVCYSRGTPYSVPASVCPPFPPPAPRHRATCSKILKFSPRLAPPSLPPPPPPLPRPSPSAPPGQRKCQPVWEFSASVSLVFHSAAAAATRTNAPSPSGMCACYVPLALLPVRRTKKEDSHMQLGSHARTLARTAKIYGRSFGRPHARCMGDRDVLRF